MRHSTVAVREGREDWTRGRGGLGIASGAGKYSYPEDKTPIHLYKPMSFAEAFAKQQSREQQLHPSMHAGALAGIHRPALAESVSAPVLRQPVDAARLAQRKRTMDEWRPTWARTPDQQKPPPLPAGAGQWPVLVQPRPPLTAMRNAALPPYRAATPPREPGRPPELAVPGTPEQQPRTQFQPLRRPPPQPQGPPRPSELDLDFLAERYDPKAEGWKDPLLQQLSPQGRRRLPEGCRPFNRRASDITYMGESGRFDVPASPLRIRRQLRAAVFAVGLAAAAGGAGSGAPPAAAAAKHMEPAAAAAAAAAEVAPPKKDAYAPGGSPHPGARRHWDRRSRAERFGGAEKPWSIAM